MVFKDSNSLHKRKLIEPYGEGKFKNLIVNEDESKRLKRESVYLPSWDLTLSQIWDIELLLNGAYSPLDGFLNEKNYNNVLNDMYLNNGVLWPIPINLDVTEEFISSISENDRIALRHPEGMVLAVMTVDDIWKPNLKKEAELVYGTLKETHPGVFGLLYRTNPVYLGGSLEGVELPPHHTYKGLRYTPSELRRIFEEKGWNYIVGFQTRNPMNKVHVELTKKAMKEFNANLLLHPAVGRTGPRDIDYFVRVRCYNKVLKYYPGKNVLLSLLPLRMRMAGPREALLHAIIRRNYGCSHFIIGRDHAGIEDGNNGNSFYHPYDAQKLALQYENELGIKIIPYEEMVYVKDLNRYSPYSKVPKDARVLKLSGSELRHRLYKGLEIPEWFTYPEVISELRRFYPPPQKQGFTIFFTGLPSSGKSTIAKILTAKLMEIGSRPVTLLDGDIVRKHLSNELGFSRRDRDINVKRIGFVAGEITKNGGVAVCAPIAPYKTARREVREMIDQFGGFIEVYVSTPLDVCEERDPKGLYAKARAGLIENFTGVSDPYEPPENPEISIDTSQLSAEESAEQILSYLKRSFIKE